MNLLRAFKDENIPKENVDLANQLVELIIENSSPVNMLAVYKLAMRVGIGEDDPRIRAIFEEPINRAMREHGL